MKTKTLKKILSLTMMCVVIGWGVETAHAQSNCFIFDGSNDYIVVPDHSSLDITTYITISCWVRRTGTAQKWAGVVSKDNTDSGLGYGITYNDTGQPAFRARIGGVWETALFTSDFPLNLWTHVAVVYDGSAMKVYMNGTLQNSEPASGSVQTNDYALYIGRQGKSSDNMFVGALDEIRIWNVARSAEEIQDGMHHDLTGSESGLVAYYDLDSYTGNGIVTDNSINTNTGTVYDSPQYVTDYPAIGYFDAGFISHVRGIWNATGTSVSSPSDGFTMQPGTALSWPNYAVFGNNNSTGISTDDLPTGVAERSARIWRVHEAWEVQTNITIDISDATGNTATPDAASDYKLLYRSGVSGDFSIVTSGSEISDDAITFNSVNLDDGYYALGGTEGALPVLLESFSASFENHRARLHWSTSCEMGLAGFLISRRDQTSEWMALSSYVHEASLCACGNELTGAEYEFEDTTAQQNTDYEYRLQGMDYSGNVVLESFVQLTTGVDIVEERFPTLFELFPVYPNPFNPATTIEFALPENQHVRIRVFDVTGRKVADLMNEPLNAGVHRVEWNAGDLSSGTYFIRIETEKFQAREKCLLVK